MILGCAVLVLCTCSICNIMYIWCCVHVAYMVLCVWCLCGTIYIDYCVHVAYVVLDIDGVMYVEFCSLGGTPSNEYQGFGRRSSISGLKPKSRVFRPS